MRSLRLNQTVASATLTAVVVLSLLYAAYRLRLTLLIFVLSVLLSYLLFPLVEFLERNTSGRISRTGCVVVVYCLLGISLTAAGTIFGKQIVSQAAELARTGAEVANDPKAAPQFAIRQLPGAGRFSSLLQQLADIVQENAKPILKRVGEELVRYARHLVFLVLIPILSFLFLKYSSHIKPALFRQTQGSNQGFWRSLLHDLDAFLAHYVRTVLALSLATVLAYGVFLSLLRVHYSLVLAGAAGFLEPIPFIGPLAAAVLVLATASLSANPHLPWVVLFLVVHRLFQDYVLNPLLMSSGLQLNPILVIFAVLAGEQLAGVPGLLLSIPVLGTLKIFLYSVQRHLERGSLSVKGEPVSTAH